MRICLLILGVLVIVAVATVPFAFPAIAAAGCPTCYGFTDQGGGLFVESGAPSQDVDATRTTIEAARARVLSFYGDLESGPRILLCRSEACYQPLGGASRGIALLDQVLILSPRGANVVIAAHELAHIEFHRRIGAAATLTRSVPQWFDEGLAVVISNDPRYLGDGPDRCRSEPAGNLPTSRTAWIETAQSANLYAQAACKVSRWLSGHGGADGVRRLAAPIANGASFEDLAR